MNGFEPVVTHQSQRKVGPFFRQIFSPFLVSQTAMGQKSDISLEEKIKIGCWSEEGVKTAEITARLGCHPAAVHKHIALLKKMLKNAPPLPTKTRKGRISKISVGMKERLRLFASRHPFKSARELKNEVMGWGGYCGQEDTVHPSTGAQDAVASRC
jgi:hypothetical protein